MSIRTLARIITPCALFACAAIPLDAQTSGPPHGTVTGEVLDGSTGAPLAAAQVRLVPMRHHEQITRADGRFALADVEPGRYTLVVERLGYRSSSTEVVLRPGGTEVVRVEMAVSALELGGLIVETGALSARSRDDVLSPVTTISGADLDRATDQTLASMLDGRPGLASTSLGPTTAARSSGASAATASSCSRTGSSPATCPPRPRTTPWPSSRSRRARWRSFAARCP
jgi:5-hydroxyisourate hydrolase-like protein (transthyretin family)